MLKTGRADADHFHEECGVFGIYGHPDAAALTALGLHALQHRGQEAAGIVAYDGNQFNAHRGPGLVGDNFGSRDVIDRLPGNVAIGHVRYATTGEVAQRNIQPLFADFEFGGLAICHNGNLTNSYQLRRQLVRRGSLFQSTSDTEVIVHLIATSLKESVVDRLIDALRQVQGAYSVVALSQDAVIGLRDPVGVRPLVLGKLADAWIMTSETCALDIIGAEFVRDVEPGEIVIVGPGGGRSLKPFADVPRRLCVFEYIYFARPDSMVEGQSVYEARKRIGRELARESHVDADIVVPVPDSGVPAALGYASESGLPFELGIIRNHYVGRTFIEPTDQIRHLGVRLKHNANRADQDRRDGPPRRRPRSSHADLQPTDPLPVFLRDRDAVATAAARGPLRCRADGKAHRRRQPRLHLDRRALPRDGRGNRSPAKRAAFLRRLFQRRLPDPAGRRR